MRLAIISDTHDNLATLEKFVGFIKKNPVDAIIHCGDIAEGETLGYLANNFGGKILAVFGNMDYRDSVETAINKLPNKISLWKEFGEVEFENLKIGFCHHRENALCHIKNNNFNYVFYGHSHKPWKENVEGCILANPGNLAGMFYKSTFAVLETSTNKLDLIIVDQLKK